ncbi:hypothetical protein BOTNAR_0824g00020 [Botryotinia narcissicola]|uniref:Uncharacterized protein n=1 Tax=Botryotinia narcissicola TaxID=278944 RepID=A0A4Z1HHD8_9HELO|nr:hypothetical protein BOTNAR_0824g00020 [Botryotinia narcissicola]
MSTPVDSSHDADQARFRAGIVKELREEMHALFILAGDSWALIMIKKNTRYELHPPREIPDLSGKESSAQLRRILQSTLDEIKDLRAERSSAVGVIEKMRSDHQKEMSLQVDNFQMSIKRIENQIQSERQETSEKLRLADNRCKALHDKSASLDSKYQKTMESSKEEQKKNLGLVSDLENLSAQHQKLRSNHEALRGTSEKVKPLLNIGIAMRLRWLENIHFMFEGHNGSILDGCIVESDSLLAQYAGLSVGSSDRVNESMQRIYGKRHVPKSADSLPLPTYPSALVFVLDWKTAAAIHQSRELLLYYPYHQRLRLILKEMMGFWERAKSRQEFESIARVVELRKEAAQIWEAVQIAFRNSKRRSRPPD